MSRQAEKSESTRAALIAAARALFTERGYTGVGTTEIVRRAGSSRGAMYHHFADKPALFRAVYEQIQQEIIDRVSAEVLDVDPADPVAALEAGLRTFLKACVEPDKARIGMIDAPAVLGWRVWRELDEQYALGLVTAAIQSGIDAGVFRADLAVRPLAHIVLAGLGEAGMLIAGSDEPDAARVEAESAVLTLLDGLRA